MKVVYKSRDIIVFDECEDIKVSIIKRLRTFNDDTDICPECSCKLRPDFPTFIQMPKKRVVCLSGKYCNTCKALYISNTDRIIPYLKDNPLAQGFTLDKKGLWNYSKEKNRENNNKKEP